MKTLIFFLMNDDDDLLLRTRDWHDFLVPILFLTRGSYEKFQQIYFTNFKIKT